MKWIGQHIWSFISRFRSDVYLEATETGTIASGGNLGLDSNNKIVKAAEVGSSVDLTSEVTGVLPVANGGSGASSLTDNSVLTGTGTSPITAEANFTYSGTALSVNAFTNTFTNATSSSIIITNTGNNTAGGFLDIKNERSNGVDGDTAGTIRFYGNDDGGNSTLVGSIKSDISETADGSERGSMRLKSLSGGQHERDAVVITSSAGNDIIDVDIGYGATSTTTIAGSLTVNGEDALFTSATSQKPVVEIRNINTDGQGPELKLNNTKGGNDGADDDYAGKITFNAMDYDGGGSSQSAQEYGRIYVRVDDATSTEESGKMLFDVANHDGGLNTALSLVGGSEDGEVDATIGSGAASVTTVAGDLAVTTKATIPSRKYELPSSTVGDYKGGDVYYYGDGSTVKGGIYYINGTNWTLADADAEASTSGLLAVALGTDPDVDGMLLRGFVTLLTEIEGTEAIGSPVYLSATDSGKATITVPASGDFVRILGYSLHASDNQVYFNPDNTWVERA